MEVSSAAPVEPEHGTEGAALTALTRKRPIIEEDVVDETVSNSSLVKPTTVPSNSNNSSSNVEDISSPSAHKPRLNVSKEAKVDRSAVVGHKHYSLVLIYSPLFIRYS